MARPSEFATVAQALQAECRTLKLPKVPAFRSPPKSNARRAIRELPNALVVAVSMAGRDLHEVTRDMIDGVIVGNRLLDTEAEAPVRDALWRAAGAVAQAA